MKWVSFFAISVTCLLLVETGAVSLAHADSSLESKIGDWTASGGVGEDTESPLEQTSFMEKELLADARDGRLDRFGLVEAALIASGIPERNGVERYAAQFRELADAILEDTAGEEDDYLRAKAIFQLLHTRVLKKYELYAVDLIGVFQRGDYNCVSATILYNSLLEQAGIRADVVLVPSHAYSLVTTGRGAVEVETTSPSGFHPARTLDEYRKLLERYRLSGGVAVIRDGKAHADQALIAEVEGERRVTDNLTLVAIIYSNLAAARLKDGDMESALALFAKATRLSRDNQYFRDSRDALLSNLVADLIQAGSYQAAIETVRRARRIQQPTPKLLARLANWSQLAWTRMAESHVEARRYQQALDVYAKALQEHPGSDLLLHNRKATYVQWGLAALAEQRFRDASSILLGALTAYPGDEAVQQNLLAAVQRYSRHLRQQGQTAHALKVTTFALEQVGRLAGPPARLQLQLQFEVGLVLFDRKEYELALARFALNLQDELFRTNWVASGAMWVQQLVDAGRVQTAMETAINLLTQPYHKNDVRLWRSYWFAALAGAKAAVESGDPLAARKVLERKPVSTLLSWAPELLQPYAARMAGILVRLERFDECVRLLEELRSQMPAADWVDEQIRSCRKAR